MLDVHHRVDSLRCSEGDIKIEPTPSTSLKITIKTDYVCLAAHLMTERFVIKLRCGNVTPLPKLRLLWSIVCVFGMRRALSGRAWVYGNDFKVAWRT
jgi:hypothetical protein